MSQRKRKTTKFYQTLRSKRGGGETGSLEFIGEEPLLVRIDDKEYSVVMRTQGEELFHAAGFCLGEGIVDSPDDFETIEYDENLDANVIDIRLKPQRRKRFINSWRGGVLSANPVAAFAVKK